jgi:hypothetical protein
MLLRRLRGILGTTALGAVAWAAVGFLVGTALRLHLVFGAEAHLGPNDPFGVIATLTILGATVGAINGFAFGVLIGTIERGRSVAGLRAWRVAAWAAIANGIGLHFFLFQSTPLLVVVGAGLGALTSAGLLRLARRGLAPDRSGSGLRTL